MEESQLCVPKRLWRETRNGAPVDDVIHGGNAALRAELVASNSDCGCTLACRRLCDEQFRLHEHVVGHDGVGHLTRGLRLEQAGLHRTAVFLVPVLALEDVEQLGGRRLCELGFTRTILEQQARVGGIKP